MKITKFSFENKYADWKLVETNFQPHINLLVGASGVGKTKILNALKIVFSTALGTSTNYLFETNWTLYFNLNDNKKCRWQVEFSKQIGDKNGSEKALIIAEKLTINGTLIFERNKNTTLFNGNSLPNLNREESLIHLLKQENLIHEIYETFKNQPNVFASNNNEYTQKFELFTNTLNDLSREFTTLEKIRNSNQTLVVKLALLYMVDNQSFNLIKNNFISVFPSVEDIKFDVAKLNESFTLFFIKEKGVKKWIYHQDISAGMFKTFIELGRIYLSPNNSLILIDEFENSLGANCIDAVTDNIVNSNRNNQFIITSHHPYIINNIPVRNWKIVSREGSVVRTHDADEFGIGKSRLSAFIELQQLDVFLTGSESIS